MKIYYIFRTDKEQLDMIIFLISEGGARQSQRLNTHNTQARYIHLEITTPSNNRIHPGLPLTNN